MARLIIAVALLVSGCDVPNGDATQMPQENALKDRAETYECSKEELPMMQKYFDVCMRGAGYFANYCLDRAVVATCHRAPTVEPKEETP